MLRAIWLIKWNLAIAPAIQQRCASDSEWDSEAYSENTDEEIDPSIIEPYQHEPVEEDREENASSEDSMSDEESSAYEERLNNINW